MKKEEPANMETGLVIKQTRSMNCSRILNLMVLFGFMVNYMLRVNFTIAIVDMVPTHKHNVSIEQATNFSTTPSNDTNVSKSTIILSSLRVIQIISIHAQPLLGSVYISILPIGDVTNFVFTIYYFILINFNF